MSDPLHHLSRRSILRAGASGIGALALGDLLARDGLADVRHAQLPVAKAKRVIWLFMAGAPSQLELFEPKETLQRLDGQPLPPSLSAGKRFAFIDGERAKLLGTKRTFARHGECGAPVSELLPNIAGIVDKLCFLRGMQAKEINHGPAKLFMNTGSGQFGRPSMGAWSLYGLGSEAEDLPGFVVLRSGGRGPRGGAPLWGNAFLPTNVAGTPFRAQGDPVLDLASPEGVGADEQSDFFDAVGDLDRIAADRTGDPAFRDRVKTYELAHKMQTSTPDLIDLTGETQETRDLYGLGDGRPSFARNCLLARRLVERGSRFVQLYHTDWDHHGDPGNHLGEPLERRCKEVDRATAGLILDLERRGPPRGHAGGLGRRVRAHAAGRGARLRGPRPPRERLHALHGGRRHQARPLLRRDRRDRLRPRTRRHGRPRPPRHHPPPAWPRPREAHLPLPGPRLPPHRRPRPRHPRRPRLTVLSRRRRHLGRVKEPGSRS